LFAPFAYRARFVRAVRLLTPIADMNSATPTIYAIDFGTSNSLLAAANAQRVFAPIDLDPRASDPTVLRSILHFSDTGVCTLGAEGLHAYVEAGLRGRLLRSLKRFLPDPAFTHTRVGTRRVQLQELIATVLRSMRERADATFGTQVQSVVLGRPAAYSLVEEEDALAEARMRQAAHLAGFEHVYFCPEPVAAARDLGHELDERRTVLIADFGGGTSDFCVVRMSRTQFSARDVLAVRGVSIAGDALDGALMKGELSHKFGANVRYQVPFGSNVLTMPAPLIDMLCTPAKFSLLSSGDVKSFLRDIKNWSLSDSEKEAVERLLIVAEDGLGFQVFEAVEDTKKALSSSDKASFTFDYPGIEFNQDVSRSAFETACSRPVNEILACLDATLTDAQYSAADVDLVCLTGGTSLVPVVRQRLSARFGDAKLRQLKGFHSVVGGLARQAQLHACAE
jgi:hypothetical chaperone protein